MTIFTEFRNLSLEKLDVKVWTSSHPEGYVVTLDGGGRIAIKGKPSYAIDSKRANDLRVDTC